MSEDSERITLLEEAIAHISVANEALSEQIVEQWKKIEALEKSLSHLREAVSDLDASADSAPANVKPPHW